MKILSIVSLSLFVLLVLAAGRAGPWSMFERVLGRIRRRPPATPLAQVADRVDLVDVEAAARHLSRGTPRNAIVACWMQLEADAGVAGLARADAETSAEYVARVVASASVDTAPIGELAALYREARFSRHDLDERHRTRAVAALLDVKSALANSPAVTA